MTPEQIAYADEIRRDFEALHGKMIIAGTAGSAGDREDAARLYALARTHLEIACMIAVKAVSRLGTGTVMPPAPTPAPAPAATPAPKRAKNG